MVFILQLRKWAGSSHTWQVLTSLEPGWSERGAPTVPPRQGAGGRGRGAGKWREHLGERLTGSPLGASASLTAHVRCTHSGHFAFSIPHSSRLKSHTILPLTSPQASRVQRLRRGGQRAAEGPMGRRPCRQVALGSPEEGSTCDIAPLVTGAAAASPATGRTEPKLWSRSSI